MTTVKRSEFGGIFPHFLIYLIYPEACLFIHCSPTYAAYIRHVL